jgi:ATP-dependent RNA helicase RhlE
VRIDVERRSAPATGITQAILPVPEQLKTGPPAEMLRRGEVETALVFTRTKHRANRLAKKLEPAGISATASTATAASRSARPPWRPSSTGGSRSWWRPTSPPAASTSRRCRTSSTSTCPVVPEDYIHRVGRTARAGKIGDALTFASPAEQPKPQVKAIERAVGRPGSARRRIEGFDYGTPSRPGRLEIPIGERLAAHRASVDGWRRRGIPRVVRRRGAFSRRRQQRPRATRPVGRSPARCH